MSQKNYKCCHVVCCGIQAYHELNTKFHERVVGYNLYYSSNLSQNYLPAALTLYLPLQTEAEALVQSISA